MLGVGPRRDEVVSPDSPPLIPSTWPTQRRRLSDGDRSAIAILVSVQGLGPITLEHLLERVGSPSDVVAVARGSGGARALVAASADAEQSWRSMPSGVAEAIVAAANRGPEILGQIEALGLRVVALGDPEYPLRLAAIEIPPLVLFVRGNVDALGAARSVAVVGTRRPTEGGRRTGARIAAAIARAGGLVVSGLAVGIDGAAHAAAVTERAATVAFIGSGHARLFPSVHQRLADAIVDGGGAVVSEYAPETAPTKGTFPRRNRLISGAADAVVVVEAGARSGALLTASWALEQGRECFVVPGSIDAPMSAGCLGFLRDWPGLVRVVSGIPQLLEDVGLAGLAPAAGMHSRSVVNKIRGVGPAAALAEAAPADHQVAAALLAGAVIADEIVAVTGLTVGGVLGALTRLEAAGVVAGRHGRYRPDGALALEPLAADVDGLRSIPPAA
jgi:DNA processing protein